MNDTEQTEIAETAQSEQPGTPSPVPAHPAPAPKKHSYIAEGFENRTRGEAAFNLLSYAGVGYLGVTAVSVLASWLLRDSKAVSPLYDKYIVQPVINLTKGTKKGAELAQHSGRINSHMTILALFTGGSIMSVLPIKWMEDNKAKLVKTFDHLLYGKDKADNDPVIQNAHKALEAAPKQTWTSVAASRLLAFVATFSTSFVIGKQIDKYSTHSGRWLDGAKNHKTPAILSHIAEMDKLSPHELVRLKPETLKHLAKGETGLQDRNTSKILSYVTLDAFYTLITSGALYVFTRVLAPIFDKEVKARARTEAAPQLSAASPSIAITQEQTYPTKPAHSIRNAELSGRLQEAPEQAMTMG